MLKRLKKSERLPVEAQFSSQGVALVNIPFCPQSGSSHLKRNGHTHYGKQNYLRIANLTSHFAIRISQKAYQVPGLVQLLRLEVASRLSGVSSLAKKKWSWIALDTTKVIAFYVGVVQAEAPSNCGDVSRSSTASRPTRVTEGLESYKGPLLQPEVCTIRAHKHHRAIQLQDATASLSFSA